MSKIKLFSPTSANQKKDRVKETDIYKCESRIENEQEISFTVTLNISTINDDYDRYAKNFKNGPVYGVNFKILDDHKLQICIRNEPNNSKGEAVFINALGVAGIHNLGSDKVDEIRNEFNQFLKDVNLKTKSSSNLAEDYTSCRPGGNNAY